MHALQREHADVVQALQKEIDLLKCAHAGATQDQTKLMQTRASDHPATAGSDSVHFSPDLLEIAALREAHAVEMAQMASTVESLQKQLKQLTCAETGALASSDDEDMCADMCAVCRHVLPCVFRHGSIGHDSIGHDELCM